MHSPAWAHLTVKTQIRWAPLLLQRLGFLLGAAQECVPVLQRVMNPIVGRFGSLSRCPSWQLRRWSQRPARCWAHTHFEGVVVVWAQASPKHRVSSHAMPNYHEEHCMLLKSPALALLSWQDPRWRSPPRTAQAPHRLRRPTVLFQRPNNERRCSPSPAVEMQAFAHPPKECWGRPRLWSACALDSSQNLVESRQLELQDVRLVWAASRISEWVQPIVCLSLGMSACRYPGDCLLELFDSHVVLFESGKDTV